MDDTVTIERHNDQAVAKSDAKATHLHLQDWLQEIGAKQLTSQHGDLAFYEVYTTTGEKRTERLLITYSQGMKRMAIVLDDFRSGVTTQLYLGSIGSPDFLKELFKNMGGSL